MLLKILGILWIISGIFWTIKPQTLKNRLKKKMSRKLRWIIYSFMLLFGLLVIGGVIRTPGMLPKIVGIAGIFITIKAILLLTSKTSEKMIGWWSERPLLFFRICALSILALGIMLVLA